MTNQTAEFRDEIELIDILRVIWKWKFRILAGTLFFALLVGIISFNMTEVYQIDMVLRPGILRIDQGGKNTYIDTPENIQALIETGAFTKEILENIRNSDDNAAPKLLNFRLTKPRYSDALKISYETTNVEQGIDILSHLSRLLLLKYEELVRYFKTEYDTQIKQKQTDIENFKVQLQAQKEIIKNLQFRIDQLKSDIDLINKNTMSLIQERDKFLSDQRKDDILSSILYTNTIQQNLSLANTYKNEIKEFNDQKELANFALGKIQNDIKDTIENIENLEFKKNSIQNVQIIQPPIASPFPVKPKKKLNIILATVVGFFAMFFLAFMVEYLYKQKKVK